MSCATAKKEGSSRYASSIRARSTRLAGSVRERAIAPNAAKSFSPIANSIACRHAVMSSTLSANQSRKPRTHVGKCESSTYDGFHGIDVLVVIEATRLINACDPEFRPLVIAALQTGCRYGELIRLEVCDFNSDAGTLAIRQSKSGKPRHVVLTDEGAAFFRRHCAGRSGHELMFRHDDGGAWQKSEKARPMAEACTNGKIKPPISFHILRHTWASLAV